MKAINESLRNVREDRRSIYKKLKRSVNVEMNLLQQSIKEMKKFTTNLFWDISRKIEKNPKDVNQFMKVIKPLKEEFFFRIDACLAITPP